MNRPRRYRVHIRGKLQSGSVHRGPEISETICKIQVQVVQSNKEYREK